MRAAIVAAAVLLAPGCAHRESFTWVDAYRDAPQVVEDGFVLAPGDVISVRVLNQENMSSKTRVRPDGMISLPLVNDVEASGVPPAVLARRLQTKLKSFFVNPTVTVALEEPRPFEISIIGEVVKSGVYRMEPGASVLKALASAGGLGVFAHKDRIFVLREGHWADDEKTPLRIRFTYESLAHVTGRAASFRLRTGDVVVVE
jgi:polysaccharide biosynthesis/export protein